MRIMSYCVGLLIIAGLTGACSESTARLSPTSPTALSAGATASQAGSVRNTTSGEGSMAGIDGAAGGNGGGENATGPGAGAGAGENAAGSGSGAGENGTGSGAGAGENAAGSGAGAGTGDNAAGPGAGSSGSGENETNPGAGPSEGGENTVGGDAITVAGVVAFASGGCPTKELRLQTEPYTIVTTSATTFVGAGAGSACGQVAQGAMVTVTGMVLPQTNPSIGPTLEATKVRVQ
jgi:hypothetical protein